MRYALLLIACLSASFAHAQENSTTIFGSWVTSGVMHLAVPKDGSSIHAFSTRTGKWTHQTLESKLPADAVPLVGGEMAVIQTEDAIYAIGSRMKRWAKLTLENPGTPATLDGSSVRVQDGRHLYGLGADSEHWEGVDLDTGSVLLPQNGG